MACREVGCWRAFREGEFCRRFEVAFGAVLLILAVGSYLYFQGFRLLHFFEHQRDHDTKQVPLESVPVQ